MQALHPRLSSYAASSGKFKRPLEPRDRRASDTVVMLPPGSVNGSYVVAEEPV